MIEAHQPAAPLLNDRSFMDAVTRDVQKHFPLFQHVGKKGKLDGKLVVAFEESDAGELRAVFVEPVSVAVAMGVNFRLFERMQKFWDVTQWCGEDEQAILTHLIVNRLHGLDTLAASSTT
jgi:hypothetical protein